MTIFDIIEKAKEQGFDPNTVDSPISDKKKKELSALCEVGKILKLETADELLDIEAFLKQPA